MDEREIVGRSTAQTPQYTTRLTFDPVNGAHLTRGEQKVAVIVLINGIHVQMFKNGRPKSSVISSMGSS